MTDNHEARVAAIKAGSVWGGTGLSYVLQFLGFGSWGDFAAFCASIYSLILISEWLWKKLKGRKAGKGKP